MRAKKEKQKTLCFILGGLLIACIFRNMILTVSAEEYIYDDLNRVVKVVYDDGSYLEYQYDSNGNVIHTTVYSVQIDECQEGNDTEHKESQGEDQQDEKQPENIDDVTDLQNTTPNNSYNSVDSNSSESGREFENSEESKTDEKKTGNPLFFANFIRKIIENIRMILAKMLRQIETFIFFLQ